jgi:CheY-like chemotaxis protein
MSLSRRCTFYRDSESLGIGRRVGYCDLDGHKTICNGDIEFCEKPDAFKEYLLKQENIQKFRDEARKKLPDIKEEQKIRSPSYRVLVVDDEEPMRRLIMNLLYQKGHQCVTASNGLEALDTIRKNKFDAVIADIVMPEMDGIALTKEISKHYPGLPVMMMTGYTDEYSAETAIASGAQEFINKPFSVTEFVIRFNKMMRDHKILRQIEAKNNEIIFHLQIDSNEKIEELKREIEKLKNQLLSPYRKSSPF